MTEEHLTEEYYEQLSKEIIEYVITMRKKFPETKILDLIHNYAWKHNLEIELVGDVLYDNEEFKSMIMCDSKPYFSRKNNTVDDW